jgi:hypothetical protein
MTQLSDGQRSEIVTIRHRNGGTSTWDLATCNPADREYLRRLSVETNRGGPHAPPEEPEVERRNSRTWCGCGKRAHVTVGRYRTCFNETCQQSAVDAQEE